MRVSFIRFTFERQDLENFLSLEFRRELQVSLAFQQLDTGLMLSPTFKILTCFVFAKLISGFSLFTGLSYTEGEDSTISSSLWKTTAFTKANKKQRFRLIGNHSKSQSFSSELHQRGSGGSVWWGQKLALSVPDLSGALLVFTLVTLDMMHQYGLGSSLHQSCSRKR